MWIVRVLLVAGAALGLGGGAAWAAKRIGGDSEEEDPGEEEDTAPGEDQDGEPSREELAERIDALREELRGQLEESDLEESMKARIEKILVDATATDPEVLETLEAIEDALQEEADQESDPEGSEPEDDQGEEDTEESNSENGEDDGKR